MARLTKDLKYKIENEIVLQWKNNEIFDFQYFEQLSREIAIDVLTEKYGNIYTIILENKNDIKDMLNTSYTIVVMLEDLNKSIYLDWGRYNKELTPIPTDRYIYYTSNSNFSKIEEFISLQAEVDEYNRRYRNLETEINNILNSVTSTNQLIKIWPEAKIIIENITKTTSKKTSTSLMVPTDNINSLLGWK